MLSIISSAVARSSLSNRLEICEHIIHSVFVVHESVNEDGYSDDLLCQLELAFKNEPDLFRVVESRSNVKNLIARIHKIDFNNGVKSNTEWIEFKIFPPRKTGDFGLRISQPYRDFWDEYPEPICYLHFLMPEKK